RRLSVDDVQRPRHRDLRRGAGERAGLDAPRLPRHREARQDRSRAHAARPFGAGHDPPRGAAERDADLARGDRWPQGFETRPVQRPGMRGAAMIRARYLIPLAIAVLFVGGGWTLRNQLAADRQGEWVNVSRADVATGVDVTGTLASAEAGSFGPPQL